MIALVGRKTSATLLSLIDDWSRASKAQRLRSIAEFAESEIIIPDGPMKGRRFRCSTQPWSKLWFDQIDSGLFQRFAATGPSQSGKTLCCYVIPTLYHLFEIGETVICGVPKMEMAHDKWRQDFLPTIMASRYADLLPQRGKGSRGGQFDSVTFRNGATLKFMTGGGDDKSRAGFTSRVVVITETDGMDESSELSREADPITQLEARTRSYGHRRRIFMECTVSTEEGRIWQEYTNGTASKIALQCPHCDEHVTPEREHFIGWDGATNAIEAESLGKFFCPKCATAWSEEQRIAANRNAVILHKGQEIQGGQVTGEMPPTRTLGFRWTATNNLFASCAELASEEWVASQDIDQDNVQKGRNQFVWTIPADSEISEVSELKIENIIARQSGHARGELPQECQAITVGIDVGKWLLHWTAKAWTSEPHGLTIDYGVTEVHSRELGEEAAIKLAIKTLADSFASGWPHHDGRMSPSLVLVDSGNWASAVCEACVEIGGVFYPSKGFGTSIYNGGRYHKPSENAKVSERGDGWHVATLNGVKLVEFDADMWKSKVHSRLECNPDQAGAILLFKAENKEHISYAKHLTAERKTQEFVVGKGLIEKWDKVRKANHWLDTESLANLAADCYGVEIIRTKAIQEHTNRREPVPVAARPDGRPWI